MDNDYFIKVNPMVFGLLHDIVEDEVRAARGAGRVTLELQELWLALHRADADHQCVDEGYRLKV